MGQFAADVRYAIRSMLRERGFTAISLAALALGIGANTAIFTVVNAVLLNPLPYPEPERIMQFARTFSEGGYGASLSVPKYMVWRNNRAFESMTLYNQNGPSVNLGSGDVLNEVKATQVSRDFFKVFGAKMLMGRTFTEAEDLPQGPPAAVVSYRLWQGKLGGSANIIGSTILLEKKPITVVGVLPREFTPVVEGVDIYEPLQADPNSSNQGHYLAMAGRLKPGITEAQANAEAKLAGENFRRRYPEWMDKNESAGVRSLRDSMVSGVRLALLVLLGAVALVLLIACANVANLLLARSAARQRELAIRAAIGASWGRMLRQLLTESVILAGAGAALGFGLGTLGVRLLLAVSPGNIPRMMDAQGAVIPPPVDWRVALFTIGVALATGILFGLFPALHAAQPDLASTLKEGGRAGTSRRHAYIRSALVVSEIALALMLLVGAALLIQSFRGLRSVSPGFDPAHVLTLKTSFAGGQYDSTAKLDNLQRQVLPRLAALPGVESAASSLLIPMENSVDLPFTILGKTPPAGEKYEGDVNWRAVTADYFKTFRIPLVRGRVFGAGDLGNSTRVILINDAMAKKYWPKGDPLGQVLVLAQGLGGGLEDVPRQVVGIVATAQETGLGDGAVPLMYVPSSQVQEGLTKLANAVIPYSWEVRTKGDPAAMRVAIEREFRAVDPLLPIFGARPMEDVVARSVASQNFNMLLLTVFATIAMLLGVIGIYGLMSYSVEQRTQEIGIRLALGGTRSKIIRMVLGQGLKLAGIGIAVGLAGAYFATRVLASLLFGVKANDPLTFGAVAGVLVLAAITASLVPAGRAAATEPSQALRRP
jgi:predicted permease